MAWNNYTLIFSSEIHTIIIIKQNSIKFGKDINCILRTDENTTFDRLPTYDASKVAGKNQYKLYL